jgi:hypothetical protein
VSAFYFSAVGGTASPKMEPNDKTVTGFVQLYEAETLLWPRPDRNYRNKNGRKLGLSRIMLVLCMNANITWKVKYSFRLLPGIINKLQQGKKRRKSGFCTQTYCGHVYHHHHKH